MKHLSALALACFLALSGPGWAAAPLNVVAAENFYGDVARQIGGPEVKVTSILSNPDQDPHLFEASPSVARNISGAQIVVYSGIDYDPWMEKLLGAARSSNRKVIVVAELIGKKTGDNPHIWYDPATMLAFAKALDRRPRRRRPRAPGRVREAPSSVRAVAAADPGQDRGAADAAGRHAGDRDGAGVRLHVRRARHAGPQSTVPARGHEQHRAERVRRSPRSRTTSRRTRSGCWSITARLPTRSRRAWRNWPRRRIFPWWARPRPSRRGRPIRHGS